MQLPGRPVPNTFEYIEAIALREPNRLALVQDNRSWTYRDLYLDLSRVTHALLGLGVKRGDRVAVGMTGFREGLLLILALENVGAATISFVPENDPDKEQLFAHVDRAFSDVVQRVPGHVRFALVGDEFFARAPGEALVNPPRPPCVALEPHEPARISRTSGSTGRSKFMVLNRRAQEWWIHRSATTGRLRPESRSMPLGTLVLNANLVSSSACLRMGAAVYRLTRSNIAAHDITNITCLPSMLEQLLDSLPPGYVARVPVDIATNGGFASAQLRARAERVLRGSLRSRYGANEVGGICEAMDAQGIGVVGAGVDLRIVDESGAELPPGRLGIISVRTPGMVAEYIGDPEASKAAFRGGWLQSGDWGTLVGPRTLKLAGRYDDLVNAGGLKVPAATVEAKVRQLVNPTDCAALAVNLDGGAITLGIALVSDTADRDGVRRAIAQGVDLGAIVGARVVFLDRLPRTDNGKIDRVALHALLASPPPGSV